jgi:adenylosuccinate synthase
MLDYVLGIVKAYATRVGHRTFSDRAHRRRRRGPRQARQRVRLGDGSSAPLRLARSRALKRSLQLNGVDGLCITKLDVLDGMDEIKVCTSYRLDGRAIDLIPTGAEAVARCIPVYETMPGWTSPLPARDRSRRCPTTRVRTSSASRP